MSIDTSMQAMGAMSVSMNVTANNVANVDTEGFKSSRVDLEEGADGGVRVSDIRQSSAQGPMVPTEKLERDSAGRTAAVPEYVEGSNTDLVREFTNMTVTQEAFSANAAMTRSWDQMSGNLVDMVV